MHLIAKRSGRSPGDFIAPLILTLCLGLAGCAGLPSNTAEKTVTLPIFPGWYEDKLVYYITTDASELAAAEKMQANYAPRLRDALPPRPRPPGLKSALERIYVFTNSEQASVLPSSAFPLGPTSKNTQYSPLWLIYDVTWKAGVEKSEIRSEEALFQAQDAGRLTIQRTDLIVNCPIVKLGNGDTLGSLNNNATVEDW